MKAYSDFIQVRAGKGSEKNKVYVKGYVNNREYIDEREIDYKLSHPTKVKVGAVPKQIQETKLLGNFHA